MEDEETQAEEIKSVVLERDDLIPPKPKETKKESVDPIKQISAIVNNEGVQMLIKGISQKYFLNQPIATATVEQSPDEKYQRILDVLGYLQQTLTPETTLKESITWIAQNSEQFKAKL